ncbi:LacI family DNA-binding transcriptional regulator [Asticcacaulis sp. EMRT-3]|uniref:LacI family DNA-binding transcriptional regulator n=1 Tax=Asticcacaulis sp. EMRT-3 TaxID=3040349 RepID=UPI0024AE8D80|nr:LacI family DNA-binding transcriptional regulator [Asticcacaulis sp. EMRT-3]MDI7773926.1 LacI family DNA-binding transcriptional regulator [Asticcacaulis sp. EMRT-3]
MASIQDVAKLAGVSTATVSRVLSGYAHVTQDMKARVMTAVTRLGYEPNGMARNLRTARTSRLIVTVPDITNIFYSNIIRGAEESAHAAGYAVLLGDVGTEGDSGDSYAGLLRRKEADGLIFLGHTLPVSLAVMAALPDAPIVNGCEFSEAITVSSVHIDNTGAAREVMEYLYNLGHTRIAALTGPMDSPISRDRFDGVVAAAQSRRLMAHLTGKIGDFSIESGALLAEQVLAQDKRPTAIFCFSDDMAMGALYAIRRAGLRCPQDVSVVGFDDIHSARFAEPPLTTVRQPMHDIGRRCVGLLLGILRGDIRERTYVTLAHQLVVRDSSAAPPDDAL